MGPWRESKAAEVAFLVIVLLGFGMHQGARMLDVGSGPYSADSFVVVGVAVGGIVCLYVAALAFLGKIHSAVPLFVIGVACSLGRLAIGAVATSAEALCVAQIVGGMGWVLIILCWMQVFSALRPCYFLPLIVGGLLLLMLMVPLVSCFAPGARYGAFVASLVLSFVLLGIALRERDSVAKRMMTKKPPRTSLKELEGRMRRTVVLTAVFSAACGFVVQLDILSGLGYGQAPGTCLMGAAVALLLLIWVLSARIERIDFDAAFAFCAAALMAAIAVRVVVPATVDVAGPLTVVLLHVFFCLLWMAVTGEAYERQLPGFFLLGVAVGAAQCSIAIGRGLCIAFAPQVIGHEVQALTIVLGGLGLATALAMAALALVPRFRHGGEGEPDALSLEGEGEDAVWAAPGQRPDLPVGYFDAGALVVAQVAEQFGLSKRESEMVSEFSGGRSARAIADEHLISEHTVKTHLKRAYAKLGVHSRQELLDLFEHAEADARRAGIIE